MAKSTPLKFCYVANFEANSVGEPEIAKELENAGHIVYRLDEFTTSFQEISDTIEEHQCDVLLYAKFRVGTLVERKKFLAGLKIPSVMWVFDLYFGIQAEHFNI